MYIKEDLNEDIIFTDRNGIALEVYNDGANIHNSTAGVDKNYNNYDSNDAAYKDVINN